MGEARAGETSTPAPERAEGHGQGKLILVGEHAVVYGHPALVAGLQRGARAVATRAPDGADRLVLLEQVSGEPLFEVVDVPRPAEPMERAWRAMLDALDARGAGVRVEVTLGLPPGAGLGSSAALAAACCRALAALLHRDEAAITRAVHASEGVFHGSPSGIDQAAALGGGLLHHAHGAAAARGHRPARPRRLDRPHGRQRRGPAPPPAPPRPAPLPHHRHPRRGRPGRPLRR